jgi:hypothetical protein
MEQRVQDSSRESRRKHSYRACCSVWTDWARRSRGNNPFGLRRQFTMLINVVKIHENLAPAQLALRLPLSA